MSWMWGSFSVLLMDSFHIGHGTIFSTIERNHLHRHSGSADTFRRSVLGLTSQEGASFKTDEVLVEAARVLHSQNRCYVAKNKTSGRKMRFDAGSKKPISALPENTEAAFLRKRKTDLKGLTRGGQASSRGLTGGGPSVLSWSDQRGPRWRRQRPSQRLQVSMLQWKRRKKSASRKWKKGVWKPLKTIFFWIPRSLAARTSRNRRQKRPRTTESESRSRPMWTTCASWHRRKNRCTSSMFYCKDALPGSTTKLRLKNVKSSGCAGWSDRLDFFFGWGPTWPLKPIALQKNVHFGTWCCEEGL